MIDEVDSRSRRFWWRRRIRLWLRWWRHDCRWRWSSLMVTTRVTVTPDITGTPWVGRQELQHVCWKESRVPRNSWWPMSRGHSRYSAEGWCWMVHGRPDLRVSFRWRWRMHPWDHGWVQGTDWRMRTGDEKWRMSEEQLLLGPRELATSTNFIGRHAWEWHRRVKRRRVSSFRFVLPSPLGSSVLKPDLIVATQESNGTEMNNVEANRLRLDIKSRETVAKEQIASIFFFATPLFWMNCLSMMSQSSDIKKDTLRRLATLLTHDSIADCEML